MLYQIIARTKEEKLHLIYTEQNISHPAAVVRDHDFQRFVVEAIQADPELKDHIKAMLDRI